LLIRILSFSLLANSPNDGNLYPRDLDLSIADMKFLEVFKMKQVFSTKVFACLEKIAKYANP